MILYPGSTATCVFTVPFDYAALSKAVITFTQEGRTRISIISTDITAGTVSNTSVVAAELSQADSLKLENYIECKVQINLLTTDGARIPSEEIVIQVGSQNYRKLLV